MKRIPTIIIALFICLTAFSQETEIINKKPINEIKLNLVPTLREFYPEINYEHIKANNIGLGLAAGVSLRDYDDYNDFQEKFRIMPYVRSYFGNNPNFSFFFEANVILTGLKKYDYYYIDSEVVRIPKTRNTIDSGFGFAYGGKFRISSGFMVEIFLGCGFYFTENTYPRIGISFGKQF